MKEHFDSYTKLFGTEETVPAMKDQKEESAFFTVQNNTAEDTENTGCNTCVIDMIGLAQAYVPYQTELNMIDGQKGLSCGTIFADLVKPYVKGSGLAK